MSVSFFSCPFGIGELGWGSAIACKDPGVLLVSSALARNFCITPGSGPWPYFVAIPKEMYYPWLQDLERFELGVESGVRLK